MGGRVRSLALGVVFVIIGCGGNAPAPGTAAPETAAPQGSITGTPVASPPPATPPSPQTSPSVGPVSRSPSVANEWPFVRTSCPGASQEPVRLVALGTSETAGWGVRADEAYSPQEAYPARYADLVCAELGRTVELRSYFPSQYSRSFQPLAWWNDVVATDGNLRHDLASATIVVLWNMASHDMVPALALGACTGDWPEPLRTCFAAASANVPAEMDALFARISDLVPEGTTVLAAPAYFTPGMIEQWAGTPYWKELKALIDPAALVRRLALKHGFAFVDTEAAFNGPTGSAMPREGLFQSDGLHPTAAGSLAIARAFAEADGLPG